MATKTIGKKKYSIFGRPLITWSRAPEQVFVDDVLFITHPDGMANNYSKGMPKMLFPICDFKDDYLNFTMSLQR